MITDTIYRVDAKDKLTAVMHVKTMEYEDILTMEEKKVCVGNYNNGRTARLGFYNIIGDTLATFAVFKYPYQSITFVNLKTGKKFGYYEATDRTSQMSRLIWLGLIRCVYNGWCVADISPNRFATEEKRKLLQTEGYYDGAPDWVRENDMKILESVTEESNPVLIFYKMKPWGGRA